MELELLNLMLSFFAACQKDPWGPMSAGALLALVSYLLFKGPLKVHVDKLLKSDMSKRAVVAAMAVVPAVVSALSEAGKWDKALGTAVASILISQGLFFLVKPKPEPESLPPAQDEAGQ